MPPAYRVKVEKCASFVDILDVCKFTTFCDRKGYTGFQRKFSRFHKIFQDFNGDFRISTEISGFRERFQILREISGEVYEISVSGGPTSPESVRDSLNKRGISRFPANFRRDFQLIGACQGRDDGND